MHNSIELLKQCDVAYFNGDDSPLTDIEYDKLKREAFKENPSDPYFVSVGSLERTGKIKLPYTMGSLNQIYENEIEQWVRKYSLNDCKTVISDKLDGTSIMLVYNNGAFSIAYSRGNGVEGADVTRHVNHIPNIPKTISTQYPYLVVRAECIMKNSVFNKKYLGEFKNPRNMVAGIMNRKESDVEVLKDIEIICYEIVDIRGDVVLPLRKEFSLELLKSLDFSVVHYSACFGKDLNDAHLATTLFNVRSNSDYELDGLVVSVDDTRQLKAQSTANTLNPEHSIKYKVLDENSIVETFVTDVEWDISMSGYFKPVVLVVPTELFGTSVKRASGFNAKFIIDNGIGKGAKIRLTKGGTVIPDIVEVIHKVSPSLPPDNLGAWQFNESGVEAELVDKNNKAVIFKQVLHFFDTYKIDQLREANLRAVLDVLDADGYDDAIIQICDLSRIEWNNIIGDNGTRIYESIQKRLGNSLPETFLGACAHMGFGFGVRKAKTLLAAIPFSSVRHITIEDFNFIDGFADKTAWRTIEGITPTMNLADKLIANGVLNFVEVKKTAELSSVNVVMTGFRDAELHSEIEMKGGKVSSSVSKNTTHLLTLDPSSNSGKSKKARELGVLIMSPDEFKQIHGL